MIGLAVMGENLASISRTRDSRLQSIADGPGVEENRSIHQRARSGRISAQPIEFRPVLAARQDHDDGESRQAGG
jgi:hypothetical protein